MKKQNLLLIIVFLLSVSIDAFSQNNVRRQQKKLWANDMNYEAVVVGIGADGTKLIKVYAYAKKIAIAKIKAKQNAVAACLFKGIHGSREKNVKPIVTDPREADSHEAYFEKFFDLETGNYVRYVGVTNDATGKDIVKMKGGVWRGGFKVGMTVSVNYDELRKEMERQGIVKKLSNVLGDKAKKPTIMVVPSDNWCIKNGFTMKFDDQGTTRTLPDYKKALQHNSDLLLVIGKLNTLMAERGFPAKNLETEMKNLENRGAEESMLTSKSGAGIAESPIDALKKTAKADIIMQLTWTVNKTGPKKSITFNLQGLDSYSGKQVAGSQGTGSPSFTAELPLLLEEAVLAHLDNFNAQLMDHFTDLAANGREVAVYIRVTDDADFDLEEEFDYDGEEDEVGFHIENWFEDNCFNGKYNLSDGTENFMKFEQVRIPMYYERKGKQRAMDTRRFLNGLRKMLNDDPFEANAKLYLRGLGEAWLIIGGKN